MTGYDLLNLIFLAIAVFVFFRLRAVLGRRTGNERPPIDPYAGRNGHAGEGAAPAAREARDERDDRDDRNDRDDNVIRLPGAGAESAGGEAGPAPASPLEAALVRIELADPAFSREMFLDGARKAHEMIVTAFAAGDRETLRRLLDPAVLADFEAAIAAREAAGQTLDQTYVGLTGAEIVDASLEGSVARITVRFTSEIVSALRGPDGGIVEGSPEAVRRVVDVWTFERDLSSRDPNWKLVATGAA